MNKKSLKNKRSVIMSDKYLSASGTQGGTVIGEHIALISFIVGIPLLIIGCYGFLNMMLGWGFPRNSAITILVILLIVMGSLLTIGGYSFHRLRQKDN